MTRISPPARSGNNSRSRSAIEVIEILRGRDSFAVEIHQGVFWQGQYLKTTEACVTLPDGATPEWVREIAQSIADEFALWQAGGPQ
jgi:hypothetical protein